MKPRNHETTEPARLRRDEKRVAGRWLIVGFLILFVIILVITVVYGGRGLAP